MTSGSPLPPSPINGLVQPRFSLSLNLSPSEPGHTGTVNVVQDGGFVSIISEKDGKSRRSGRSEYEEVRGNILILNYIILYKIYVVIVIDMSLEYIGSESK